MTSKEIHNAMRNNSNVVYKGREYEPIAVTVRKHKIERKIITQAELKELTANSVVVVSPEYVERVKNG